jgi:hypothetical protein
MEDDELLFEIKQSMRKSRTTFQSVLNKKELNEQDLDEMMNQLK